LILTNGGVDNVGGYACTGQDICGKSLYLLPDFSMNLKVLLKNEFFKKRECAREF
jgi:hypothetical protein